MPKIPLERFGPGTPFGRSAFRCAIASAAFSVTSEAAGPCDIYAAAGTPCVAAHATTRALFSSYAGALYQVRRKDGALKDIPVKSAGGYVDAAVQEKFCAGTSCTISILYDQSAYHNDLKKSGVAH